MTRPKGVKSRSLASLRDSSMCSPSSPESTSSVTMRSTRRGSCPLSDRTDTPLSAPMEWPPVPVPPLDLIPLSSSVAPTSCPCVPAASTAPPFLMNKSLLCLEITVTLAANAAPYSAMLARATSARSLFNSQQ